ncbi:MAG: TIGR01777 family oxidoreductase [Syntrophobacteraceae bacterium]
MKVFLTGGTGFVGGYVSRRLAESGCEVVVLSRSARPGSRLPTGVALEAGDSTRPGAWQERIAECDAVINLAGASIFTRWTKEARKEIVESRILTTRHVVDALRAGRQGKKTLLISASAVGFYGGRMDDALLEEGSPAGSDFLAGLSREWEAEARAAESAGIRVVICRFGIVFGRRGGALEKMIPAFRRGLGSPIGSGKQWFSWVHVEDLFRIMAFLMEREGLSGVVNCTAPNPVTNEELTRALAHALKRPLIAPSVPGFLVRMVLGEFGDVLLTGQRVAPKRLLEEGFQFQFPELNDALEDLVH